MNKRIEQLAKHAFDKANDGTLSDIKIPKVFIEEFAESIIEECAKFLDENSGYDGANNAWHPEPEDLLEHFGVK